MGERQASGIHAEGASNAANAFDASDHLRRSGSYIAWAGTQDLKRFRMTAGYKIDAATPEDIPVIVTLQDPNVIDRGGSLSVRHTADWFRRTMLEMPIIVARRDGKVVGYVLATSLAAQAHVAIVQAMLQTFPPSPDCYLYGPVCVADSERGNGLAGAMFEELKARLPERSAMTFIRGDNAPSLKAHRRMGMQELGPFTSEGVPHVAFAY